MSIDLVLLRVGIRIESVPCSFDLSNVALLVMLIVINELDDLQARIGTYCFVQDDLHDFSLNVLCYFCVCIASSFKTVIQWFCRSS